MITLLICGSMLTSVAFGREHILLGFDSLVLSGPDIPSECFDPIRCRIAKLRAPTLSVSDHFCTGGNPGRPPTNYYKGVYED